MALAPGKSADLQANRLTDVELELMHILWSIGEGSVKDVMAGLSENRALAYTSVSTIMRILEQKQIVTSRKEGRGHVYIPRLQKSDYEASAVQLVVAKVFSGEPTSLVRQLLNATNLSPSDLAELKRLIVEKEAGQ